MSAFINLLKTYPRISFGTFMGTVNLLTMKQSPMYDKDKTFSPQCFEFSYMSVIKGLLYGSIGPVPSAIIIGVETFMKPDTFKNHFIPFSRCTRKWDPSDDSYRYSWEFHHESILSKLGKENTENTDEKDKKDK